MILKNWFSLILFFGAMVLGDVSAGPGNPEELGEVHWLRDMKSAKEESLKSDKPILILFQEVPGCMTCKNYGNRVLSHPLIVETIETLFTPLAIFNNRRGHDAEVLKYYSEPSWNNPVIRVVGPDQQDILPRLNANYTPYGLIAYMIEALEKTERTVPEYLSLVAQELKADEATRSKTTLSMFCFWTGEKELGKLDGVVHTEAGFMNGREVVNVFYNPEVIGLEEIIQRGQSTQCADEVYVQDIHDESVAQKVVGRSRIKASKSFKLDREPKYYLSRTLYKYLPMSPIQAVKANALVGQQKDPQHIFSTRQLQLLAYIQQHQDLSWKNQIHNEQWKEDLFKLLDKAKVGV